MSKSKTWVAALAAGLVAAAALVIFIARRDDRTATNSVGSVEPAAGRAAYRWPLGQALSYNLSLDEATQVALGQNKRADEKLDGHLVLEAQIQTINLESTPEGHLVELRFTAVRSLKWTLSGVDIGTGHEPEKVFAERSVLVRYDDHGVATSIQHRPDAPSAFVSVTDRLIRQLQAPLVGGVTTWQRKMECGFGYATTHGNLGACDGEGACQIKLVRRAADYGEYSFVPPQITEGSTRSGALEQTLLIAPAGFAKDNLVHETIVLSRDARQVAKVIYTAELRFVGQHTVDAKARLEQLADARYAERDPAEVATGARLDALKKRVGDWSFEQIASDFAHFGAEGRMPEHNKWLWKTVGLILLHPETAAQLSALARADGAPPRGRALLLDVLGSAGNPEAQAAMREILSSDSVEAEPEYAAMVQRFILVEEPETESLDFLDAIYDDDDRDGNVRYGAVTALGAAISRVAQHDPAAASRRGEAIAKDLSAASDDVERRALIGALGNTRLPEAEDEIRAYGDSENPRVRGEVAGSMESIPTDGAVDYLIAVVGSEPDANVQARAIRALANRMPTEPQLAALARAVATGPLAEVNLGHLVNTVMALSRNGVDREGLVAVLVAAKARGIRTARIRNAVEAAIAELRAQN